MTNKTKWWMTAAAGALLLTGCYERETGEEPGDLSETDTDGMGAMSAGGASASNGNSNGDSNTNGDSNGGGDTDGDTDGGSDTNGDSDSDSDSDSDGDTDGDSSDTGNDGDAGGLEELIGTLCTWDFECCDDGEIDYRLGPFATDAADCEERYVEQLFSNDDVAETPRGDLLYVLGFAVRLDRSTPNRKAVSECKEQLQDRPCNEPLGDEYYCEAGDDPAENPCDLRHLFTGTQEIGDRCSGALASLGYDIECEAGSSCEEVDGDFICVDKGLDGDFCERDSTCDQGLYCNLAEGRCAPKSGLGEPCHFDDPDQPDPGTETLKCLEHLTCDPFEEKCVQYCSTGYDCAADASCSEDESCIPVDIDDGTYDYCAPRGDTNGDRCDTDRDCVDSMHCNGSACVTDIAQGNACVQTKECQAGLYCDTAGSGDCEIVANANELCSSDAECNPSTTIGCITGDDGRRCRTTLLDNGDPCAPGENTESPTGNWCESGVCEVREEGEGPECHNGASVGEECDETNATHDIHRCELGAYCMEEECRAKQPAGGDCSDDAGLQCLNGSCAQVWQDDYCTDATPLGDTSVITCDGQD